MLVVAAWLCKARFFLAWTVGGEHFIVQDVHGLCQSSPKTAPLWSIVATLVAPSEQQVNEQTFRSSTHSLTDS